MVKFSILLILVAFVALGITLAPMVSPNDTSLLNLLEPLLCDSGDNMIQEVGATPRRVDSTSDTFVIDMTLLCKRADGTTYNVTDKLFGIGIIGFHYVFLLFGVLFLIIGIIRAMSGGGGGKSQPAGSTGWTPPYYVPPPTPTPSGGAYPQVTPQPGYGSSYPSTVGYNAPTVSVSSTTPSDTFNFDSAQTMQNIPKPSTAAASSSGQGGGDLTLRLKQLREAHDAGLISNEEYERTKSDLLRDFSDDN